MHTILEIEPQHVRGIDVRARSMYCIVHTVAYVDMDFARDAALMEPSQTAKAPQNLILTSKKVPNLILNEKSAPKLHFAIHKDT